MSVSVSRREVAVLGFFWVMVVSIAVMTLVNLVGGPAAKPQPQAQATNAAGTEARIVQLEARLKVDPEDVETMVTLGDIYMDTRRAMEAFRLFQRAVELEPGHAHAQNDLAGLYQQIGQYDKALESYRRAYESQPEHSASLLNMALIYSRHKGEDAKALELLRKFLAGNPEAQLIATAEREIARIEQGMREPGNVSSNAQGTSH
ncbi:hypothetical protein DBW_0234 [Desulfuromonas sp. DDH964]|uniref:tetratricopeptide repeat protein n=1 Tax=Desulfuromonas sp. DDH964 TaxID=1823759 RepID=UPI00078CD0A3|nr:tetratricopeptide repeat protein [Desulfuromonas sp. DDH964]AMV70634.1 hypothetical protein DBW_0234 [Desulfuromonas sp. DDH964]